MLKLPAPVAFIDLEANEPPTLQRVSSPVVRERKRQPPSPSIHNDMGNKTQSRPRIDMLVMSTDNNRRPWLEMLSGRTILMVLKSLSTIDLQNLAKVGNARLSYLVEIVRRARCRRMLATSLFSAADIGDEMITIFKVAHDIENATYSTSKGFDNPLYAKVLRSLVFNV